MAIHLFYNPKTTIKQIWVPKRTRPPKMIHPECEIKFITWPIRKG